MAGAGLTRRGLLVGLGAVGAGAALGGGVAIERATADGDGEDRSIPFHGPHQAGIVTPQQDRLVFGAFDLTVRRPGDLRDLLLAWSRATARMTAGHPVRVPDERNRLAPPADTGEALDLPAARLTVTLGFGPSLFSRVGLAGRRPAPLAGLPPFPGDALEPARSGGDIGVQACADDPQVAFHAVRNLARIGFGAAALRWSQMGFGRTSGVGRSDATPRNLMGFRDGTNNLDAADAPTMDANVWVGPDDEPAWMRGGTYLVARRIRMRLEAWDRTGLDEQERIFGRRKTNGAPFGRRGEHDRVAPALEPPDAHIMLANQRRAGSEAERILRRGYSFTDGIDPRLGELDAGLFFLAFQRDPRRQFVPIQARLAARDGLNEYIVHTGSGLFACPPGTRPGGYVGETLLDS